MGAAVLVDQAAPAARKSAAAVGDPMQVPAATPPKTATTPSSVAAVAAVANISLSLRLLATEGQVDLVAVVVAAGQTGTEHSTVILKGPPAAMAALVAVAAEPGMTIRPGTRTQAVAGLEPAVAAKGVAAVAEPEWVG